MLKVHPEKYGVGKPQSSLTVDFFETSMVFS